MASGHLHDKATKQWSLVFALIISMTLDLSSGILGGLAFAIGGLFLSPDLDTKSKALKRWGILQCLWWPYRKLISHRSFWSHSPLIGNFLRIAYLISSIILFKLCLQAVGLSNPTISVNTITKLVQHNHKYFIAIFLGLEASSWLHLIQDGDPLLIKWPKWRDRGN